MGGGLTPPAVDHAGRAPAPLAAAASVALGDEATPLCDTGCSAELANPETASGLADMLHQFVAQTLIASPAKTRQARALSGKLYFRAAEDPSLAVRLEFARGRIRVGDVPPEEVGRPALTADFLSIAHMTTGVESPARLLREKRIRADVSLSQGLFLMRALRFMRVEPEALRDGVALQARAAAGRRRRLVVALLVAAALGVALVWWLLARGG